MSGLVENGRADVARRGIGSRWSTGLAAAALLFGLAALACKSDQIPVGTNFDPLWHFPLQATFVWDDAASSLPNAPGVDPVQTVALLKDVANEAFAAHGYRAVQSADADYRLSYQYSITTFQGQGASYAWGSVSLMLVDNATGRRVWLGFGRAEVHIGLSPEERRARLQGAMTRMLEKFPPSQRPPE